MTRSAQLLFATSTLAACVAVACGRAASPTVQPSSTPSALTVAAPAVQPGEMRALWVVRSSLTSPESITHVVAVAKEGRFNTLFVQVRGRGDAYYRSSLEPRAEELAGQPASFDPLGDVIQLGHAAGLKVYAWLDTCLVWSDSHRPLSPDHVVNAHPDWLDADAAGNHQVVKSNDCEGAFLSPANLDARRHIHDVFLDVASNYDIDGIQFDYVRYPCIRFDYSNASLTRFRQSILPQLSQAQIASLDSALRHDRIAYPHAFPAEYADFRRQQVTDMVAQISHDLKAIKPSLVITADVFADYKDAYNSRCQEWKTWLRDGYVDAVCPMAYGKDTGHVSAQIKDAVAAASPAGRYVFAGIGAWHITAASAAQKVAAARADGAQGVCFFSYGGITHDGTTTAYVDSIAKTCFPAPTTPPAMAWLPTTSSTPSTSSQAAASQTASEPGG